MLHFMWLLYIKPVEIFATIWYWLVKAAWSDCNNVHLCIALWLSENPLIPPTSIVEMIKEKIKEMLSTTVQVLCMLFLVEKFKLAFD